MDDAPEVDREGPLPVLDRLLPDAGAAVAKEIEVAGDTGVVATIERENVTIICSEYGVLPRQCF